MVLSHFNLQCRDSPWYLLYIVSSALSLCPSLSLTSFYVTLQNWASSSSLSLLHVSSCLRQTAVSHVGHPRVHLAAFCSPGFPQSDGPVLLQPHAPSGIYRTFLHPFVLLPTGLLAPALRRRNSVCPWLQYHLGESDYWRWRIKYYCLFQDLPFLLHEFLFWCTDSGILIIFTLSINFSLS